jgi:hypothetical protein
MQDHYLPHQYDLSKLIYDTPECSDDYSKKIIKIFDTVKDKPLYIQTPELINLFGIIKKKNYSEIILPLGGVQCLVFKNFISNLENKILKDANTYKHSWFSQKASSATASASGSPNNKNTESKKNVINSKSIKYVPVIKEINREVTTTMDEINNLENCNDGLIKIKILESTVIKKESKQITADELTKNNKVRMILQIYAVWVTMKPLDDDNTNFISTFSIYLKPEIIEEKIIYNLNFIEENKIIFESDDEDNESEEDSSEED